MSDNNDLSKFNPTKRIPGRWLEQGEYDRLKTVYDLVVTEEEVECGYPDCLYGQVWDTSADKTTVTKDCPKCHGTGRITKRKPGALLEALETCVRELLSERLPDTSDETIRKKCEQIERPYLMRYYKAIADAKAKAGLT